MTPPLSWPHIYLGVNFQVLLSNTSYKIKCRSRHLISQMFKKLQLKNIISFSNMWFWKTEGFLKFKSTLFLLRDVSWETCMRVKKQQLELDMGQLTSSKFGKEYVKAIYCHPAYLTYMQSISCEMLAGWSSSWKKTAGRNINNLTYADAAAAKSLQSCLTLCDPIDGRPPGSAVPGILQARTLEWVAISFSNAWKWKVKVKSLSHFRLLATPWSAAYQAPLPMGFSRQEYRSGVPLPSLD